VLKDSPAVGQKWIKRSALALCMAIFLLSQQAEAQGDRSKLVRLIRIDGSRGSEVAARIVSNDAPVEYLAGMRDVSIYGEPLGALIRLRVSITLLNNDTARRITRVEWRLDIYDESLGAASMRVYQTDRVKIDPATSAKAEANFAAFLPDRMLALLQLTGITFENGTTWSPAIDCRLEKDFKAVTCKPQPK
jgi:hypothetical protein